MANEKVKKVILQKKIEGEIYDLFVRTGADNVYLEDGSTVAAKLAEIAAAGFVTTGEMSTAISGAIDRVIDGAPEALNTLKELADWVADHADLYDGLVNGLAGKVDKVEGKGLSTEDFTSELKTKLEGLSNYSHPASHSADMIDETAERQFVTSNEKSKIAESGRILVGATVPVNLAETDLFLQIIE